jgi:hypothetical protein
MIENEYGCGMTLHEMPSQSRRNVWAAPTDQRPAFCPLADPGCPRLSAIAPGGGRANQVVKNSVVDPTSEGGG